jgi:16S rRNA (adenine1518-N6/adenine1519-N6)-dimethyltransferase
MQNINTRETVRKYNLRLTKTLGQNFLVDDGIIEQIITASGIDKNDLVIEIGPGVGSMTAGLAEAAGFVIAIEIDRHLIPALEKNLENHNNVVIINQDVLKTDIKGLIHEYMEKTGLQKVKVAANLPYYITTPIIMKLLEEDPGICSMIFMVQKEVADRMAAKPGKKDYGSLSVVVQYYSNPMKILEVPPHSFIPQPDVDSAVIRLNIYADPPVNLRDKALFFKVIKAAFGQRRKTLLNALHNSGIVNKGKEQLKEILENNGIIENQRGETLTIDQFAELSNVLADYIRVDS